MIIFHVRILVGILVALILGYYMDYWLQVDKKCIKQMALIDNTDWPLVPP